MSAGMSDEDLVRMRPLVGAFMRAVRDGDTAAISRVYEKIWAEFRVYPSHAVAVVLAAEVMTVRDRWAAANGEATKYAEAYLDEKRRVRELRDILDARAAAVPAGRGRTL